MDFSPPNYIPEIQPEGSATTPLVRSEDRRRNTWVRMCILVDGVVDLAADCKRVALRYVNRMGFGFRRTETCRELYNVVSENDRVVEGLVTIRSRDVYGQMTSDADFTRLCTGLIIKIDLCKRNVNEACWIMRRPYPVSERLRGALEQIVDSVFDRVAQSASNVIRAADDFCAFVIAPNRVMLYLTRSAETNVTTGVYVDP